jgi:hypothetical protein
MSERHVTEIPCRAGCGSRVIDDNYKVPTAEELRRTVVRSGWRYEDEKPYCYPCYLNIHDKKTWAGLVKILAALDGVKA